MVRSRKGQPVHDGVRTTGRYLKIVKLPSLSLVLALLSLFAVAGCGQTSATTATVDERAEEVPAPTVPSTLDSAPTQDPVAGDPTTTTSAVGRGDDEVEPASPSSTELASKPVVLTPGDRGSFTSPSRNITCSMSADFGVSCWISEKQWTTTAAPGPGCEDADFGNAIDVTGAGVMWPCYTDFAWDPGAPPLMYGEAMQVGDFQCESAETGVTCRNGSSEGFRLARAAITTF